MAVSQRQVKNKRDSDGILTGKPGVVYDVNIKYTTPEGIKLSTAAGAKRVLSVALGHARKYRYIETNAARDTLTKFGKSDKTPDPYTPEQVRALM